MNKLKARRETLNLTQKQVAELCGMKQQAYQQYECEKKLPNVKLGIKIAKALECTVEALYDN